MVDELSVFFPAYNEEKNIKSTVEKAAEILPQVARSWEILVVNDGSTDRTGEIIGGLIRKDPRLRMITHNPNRGYGAALATGFYKTSYKLVAFTDSDGQFDFSEISKFLEKQQETGADLVIGYYLKRQVPFYRLLGTRAWQLMVFSLFDLNVRDIDCAFKLIKREVLEKIPPLESGRGPFISSELLIKAKKMGFKIIEVGVHHYPRTEGQSTGASMKVVLSGLSDLIRLNRKLKG